MAMGEFFYILLCDKGLWSQQGLENESHAQESTTVPTELKEWEQQNNMLWEQNNDIVGII
jgi:hypothetical protein